MPATKADIRRKAMKKRVDEGYVKQKPGKTSTKVELVCQVCKVFKCNMTAKGVEAKGHLEKCKGKSLLECFGSEAATFYGEGVQKGPAAKGGKAAPAKAVAKKVAEISCKHKKCTFLPSPEETLEGYCCGKCRKAAKALISPDHGPKCEKKPDGSEE